jgi:CubicO group peptidase (beta-lactamase class C family)
MDSGKLNEMLAEIERQHLAIDQGALQGVDQKVADFFVGQSFANPDPRKSGMTLDHVLTMSSGLRWEGGDPEYQATCEAFVLTHLGRCYPVALLPPDCLTR